MLTRRESNRRRYDRKRGQICQHCHTAMISRPRDLCWRCYYTPGVRELYPSISKFGFPGYGNGFGERPAPPQSTTARPGSEEKIEVLARRAAAEVGLWHPQDA